jgi:hypothetical protein
MLFPRRDDISIAQVEAFLQEWNDCGLVIWYRSNGDQWVCFPSFHKHQVGFDKRHEADSVIPGPPGSNGTDIVRTDHVQSTGNVPPKGSEVKGSEVMVATEAAPPAPAKAKKPTVVIPPAVAVYRDVVHFSPMKCLWEQMDKCVGDKEEDLAFWRRVILSWVAVSGNPKNVKRMMKKFKEGVVPGSSDEPYSERYQKDEPEPPPFDDDWDIGGNDGQG